MQRDFKRISIENIVHKAFMDIEEDPRRGLRNLVDLGVNFAKGRFQKPFLRTIQNMLEDEESAYYTLLEQLLKKHTSLQQLRNFLTEDVRPDREERWLNLFLKKINS